MGSGSHLCVDGARRFAPRLGRRTVSKGTGVVFHRQFGTRGPEGRRLKTCRLQGTLAESSWDIPAWAPNGADSERGPKQGESLLGSRMAHGKRPNVAFSDF